MKSIKNLLIKRVKEIEQLQEKVKKSLEKAPEGSLVISKSGGKEQYYHKTQREQKKGTYILKENMKLICALAQKDYDKKFLEFTEKNKKLIEKLLELLSRLEIKDVYYKQSQARQNLTKPHIMSDEQYVEQWLNVKYTGKEFAQNTPMLITERGERVRSKTEKIIADKLFAMGIPYRYEYPVKIKGYGYVYPDFALLNAGKNLIVTYETSQYPLNMKVVENMLREFVLE